MIKCLSGRRDMFPQPFPFNFCFGLCVLLFISQISKIYTEIIIQKQITQSIYNLINECSEIQLNCRNLFSQSKAVIIFVQV